MRLIGRTDQATATLVVGLEQIGVGSEQLHAIRLAHCLGGRTGREAA